MGLEDRDYCNTGPGAMIGAAQNADSRCNELGQFGRGAFSNTMGKAAARKMHVAARTQAEKDLYEAEAACEVARARLAVERAAERLAGAEKSLQTVRDLPVMSRQPNLSDSDFDWRSTQGVIERDLATRALDRELGKLDQQPETDAPVKAVAGSDPFEGYRV